MDEGWRSRGAGKGSGSMGGEDGEKVVSLKGMSGDTEHKRSGTL